MGLSRTGARIDIRMYGYAYLRSTTGLIHLAKYRITFRDDIITSCGETATDKWEHIYSDEQLTGRLCRICSDWRATLIEFYSKAPKVEFVNCAPDWKLEPIEEGVNIWD